MSNELAQLLSNEGPCVVSKFCVDLHEPCDLSQKCGEESQDNTMLLPDPIQSFAHAGNAMLLAQPQSCVHANNAVSPPVQSFARAGNIMLLAQPCSLGRDYAILRSRICNSVDAELQECCLGIRYKILQYNTIQYHTIQQDTVQLNTIQYNTTHYSTEQHNTIQCHFTQYQTIQVNARQHNAIQHNTI